MSEETQEEKTARFIVQTAEATAKTVASTAQAAAAVIARDNIAASLDIAVLKNDVAALKSQNAEMSKTMKDIFDQLREIATGRPTWAVTIIIGVLTSLCVGLIVFTVTHV